MEIGAQFYTLREHCQDLKGLEESLKKVAAIGYKTVQLSGVCAYEPAWIKEKLEENHLPSPPLLLLEARMLLIIIPTIAAMITR